jgi:hypothetical protein
VNRVESQPFASFGEKSGVRVDVFNESRPYGYSNLFHVKLRVVARFSKEEEGYERILERLGVSDVDLSRVRAELLANFEARALPYLLRPDFPTKLSDHRRRERRKVVHFPGAQ